MVTGQRGGVLREVEHEGRLPQAIADELLPDVLRDLAGHGVILDADAIRLGDLNQPLTGRLDGDLLTDCLRERLVQVEPSPLSPEVVLGAIGERDRRRSENVARRILDQIAGQVGHLLVGRVGLVGLHRRKLGRMRRICALVTEILADLVDLLEPTDDGALQVELGGDTEVEVLIVGVDMRLERARGRAAV